MCAKYCAVIAGPPNIGQTAARAAGEKKINDCIEKLGFESPQRPRIRCDFSAQIKNPPK